MNKDKCNCIFCAVQCRECGNHTNINIDITFRVNANLSYHSEGKMQIEFDIEPTFPEVLCEECGNEFSQSEIDMITGNIQNGMKQSLGSPILESQMDK